MRLKKCPICNSALIDIPNVFRWCPADTICHFQYLVKDQHVRMFYGDIGFFSFANESRTEIYFTNAGPQLNCKKFNYAMTIKEGVAYMKRLQALT